LENPEDTWGHVFDNQLDEKSRMMVCLVVFNGGAISEKDLNVAYNNLIEETSIEKNLDLQGDFYSVLKVAVGAVIDRKMTSSGSVVNYDLFNPAVGDYVLRRYSQDINSVFKIVSSLNTISSIANINSMRNGGVFSEGFVIDLVKRMFHYFSECGKQESALEYYMHFVYTVTEFICPNEIIKQYISKFVRDISINDINESNLYKFVTIVSRSSEAKIIKLIEFDFNPLFHKAMGMVLDHGDFVALGDLIYRLNEPYVENYERKIIDMAVEYWSEIIEDDVKGGGVLDDYYDESDDYSASGVVWDHVTDAISEYQIKFTDDDIESIVDCCNVSSIIEDNRSNARWSEDESEYRGHSSISVDNQYSEIDDLFARD